MKTKKEGILGVLIAPSVQVKNGKLYYRKEKV